ncbi:hypothetical protein [Photobacterium lutimaris]|uniref:Uncharacterized protein n=1 Tax=Photobacterium lutimaris TaxID=388278 RepID=A0A2T3IUQ0_9GAMM|nr:hypothetical protein [Photobacterium lutimaris]PSU32108.1 hypothetical protein C9I99_20065 [Photobacterium lutimaris]TDR73766.1 hypothetical protein DFP78_110137 [Photobacterium lutimaris]
MSVASYLLFCLLGLLTMLLVQGLEAILLLLGAADVSALSSHLASWLLIDSIWLAVIAIGLYHQYSKQ